MPSSYNPGAGIGGTTGTTDNAPLVADGTGGSKLKPANTDVAFPAGITGATLSLPFSGQVACSNLYFTETLDGTRLFRISSGGAELTTQIGFTTGIGSVAPDTILLRDAANTLAQRNSTNGQTWIVSRTFTDSSNFSQFKTVVTGSIVAFTISELGTGVGTLTGYTFDKSVTAPNIPVVDTGWTANADGGSKSAVVPSSATLATIQTGLNLAVAGSGDALAATAAKVKALEAALVALLLPNA